MYFLEDVDSPGRAGFCGRLDLLEDLGGFGRHGFLEDMVMWKTDFLEGQDCLEDLEVVGRLAIAGRTGDVGRP